MSRYLQAKYNYYFNLDILVYLVLLFLDFGVNLFKLNIYLIC